MTNSNVLVQSCTNKYIDAGNDEPILYGGSYRTMNDILLDGISDYNRQVIVDMIESNIQVDNDTCIPIKIVKRNDYIYNVDDGDDTILSDDDITSYIGSIIKEQGWNIDDMTRMEFVVIRVILLSHLLHNLIDRNVYRQIVAYVNEVI